MNNSFVFSVDVQQNTGATDEVRFRFTDNERWTHKQLQTAIEDRCGIAGSLSTKEDVLLVPGLQEVTRETASDLKFIQQRALGKFCDSFDPAVVQLCGGDAQNPQSTSRRSNSYTGSLDCGSRLACHPGRTVCDVHVSGWPA